MQSAATLLSVIQKRGTARLPLERLYRHLFNRDLYLLAYTRIYRNKGSMTPGITPETVDGMSVAKIDAIIDCLRAERYVWTPVRRVMIPKPHTTKRRPLGLPTWSDKLLQEVIRLLLDAYYDPQFSPRSHGFRPARGCHTALTEIRQAWTGTTWFIEGDIAQCFDHFDHTILLGILSEKIHDGRFLRLIRNLLRAGYVDHWKHARTLSGVPQGSILGPLLSNVYLDRLDTFVETHLIPHFNRGARRRPYGPYTKINSRIGYLRHIGQGASPEARRLLARRRTMPSIDPYDPDYRRLTYIRYADDFLLGFAGPRDEALVIKDRLRVFLATTLNLTLAEEKTILTHARTAPARFLGYEIGIYQANDKVDATGRRSINGCIDLRVPQTLIPQKSQRYTRRGKPTHRYEMVENSVFSIIATYQAEYRGLVEYYRLARNLSGKFHRLEWVMELSLAKTLAVKLKLTVNQVFKRYRTLVPGGTSGQYVLQERIDRPGKAPLIAQWGGISLKWQPTAHLNDAPYRVWNNRRSELLQRLLHDRCELCQGPGPCETHHIRALKDLQRKGQRARPPWVQEMAARRRKTLVVCVKCHDAIHGGRIHGLQPRI